MNNLTLLLEDNSLNCICCRWMRFLKTSTKESKIIRCRHVHGWIFGKSGNRVGWNLDEVVKNDRLPNLWRKAQSCIYLDTESITPREG